MKLSIQFCNVVGTFCLELQSKIFVGSIQTPQEQNDLI